MLGIDKVCYNIHNNKLGVVYLPRVCCNLNTEGGDAVIRARKAVSLGENELLNSIDD